MRGTPKRQVLLGNTKSVTYKIWTDCRVPLDVFLECLFDKDYSGLVRSGKPPKHIVMEAWGKIYVEYADLSNDSNPNELFELTIKINYLASKIFIIDKCVKHFGISWNDELYKILRFYGVDFGITIDDALEVRVKKLKRAKSRASRWRIDLDVMYKEFEKMQGDAESTQGGIAGFEHNLLNISAYRKYAILAKDISVRQYIKVMKTMEQEYIRIMAKQTH